MNIKFTFLVAVFLLLSFRPPLVRAGEFLPERDLPSRMVNPSGVTDLEISDAGAFRVVDLLRRQFKIPICFEAWPLDIKTQGVSAQEKYDALAAQKSLSPTQAESLKRLSELVKKTPRTNVDWKETKYELNYTNQTALSIVTDVFAKLGAEFSVSLNDSFIVLTPRKGSVLKSKTGHIEIPETTLGGAIAQLQPLLDQDGVTFVAPIGFGGNVADCKVVNFVADDLTLLDLLVKLGQATTPPVYWNLGGFGERRSVIFHPLR